MKFAFSTLACPKWSGEQIVDHAVHMGYDGIELRLLDGEILDPMNDADKIVDVVLLARTQNIDVCALDTSCTLNQSTPEERAQQVETLRAWINLARKTHIPVLRVFGGHSTPDRQPQLTPEEEDSNVAEVLRTVAPEAEQANVRIALETHDAYSSARRVSSVLQQVQSQAIGALWDSQHPYRVGESATEVMQLLGERIVHVHVKDALLVPPARTEWQLVLLGEGEVPVREQLQLLRQHGYSGYISVEWEKRWHLELADPEIALPEHLAWLKRLEVAL